MRQIGRIAAVTLAFVSVTGCGSQGRNARRKTSKAGAADEAYIITPVEGQSWLKHLGLQVPETKLGEMGGKGPIPATPRREPQQRTARALNEPFTLTGADLYRLNCQTCHGPDGEGNPPEINSLIGPVQGTSPALIQDRLKKRDTSIDDALAKQLADQAEAQLRDRLRKGGKKMPPFSHLRGDEVNALMGYLDYLAKVPGSTSTGLSVTEPAARVGEHIVKGTCHICHDATGPGRMAHTSLASVAGHHSLGAVLTQVHNGSPRKMQIMMPALPLFTDNEVAAAYFYLKQYPPRP